MLDPFPIPQSRSLAQLVQPISDKLALYNLPLHLHEVIIFFVFYTVLQRYISPIISHFFFPQAYASLNRRTKINWDIHVVSFVQSIIVCAWSAYAILYDEERAAMGKGGAIRQGVDVNAPGSSGGDGFGQYGYWERVFGYTGSLGLVQAAGCGYFLWDLVVSTTHYSLFGPGILAHAICALTVFSFGFRPFVNYYAPSFLLYELSSPFLNIHWFCDKLNLTGSKLQLYNGFLLLGTFMACRLIWGTYQSFSIFYDIYLCYTQGPPPLVAARIGINPPVHATTIPESNPRNEIDLFMDAQTQVPIWMAVSYLASNITLNSLNWVWFGKMIETIRKRFPPPLGTMRVDKGEKVGKEKMLQMDAGENVADIGVSRGVYADGQKSLEVEKTEIRKRPAVQRLESEQVFVP